MHKMAIRTNSLNPEHRWVPWVVINGIFRQEYQDKATQNLLHLLCKLFRGPPPTVCTQIGSVPN